MSDKKNKLTLSIIIRSLLFNTLFYLVIGLSIIFYITPLSFCRSPKPMRKAILNTIHVAIWCFENVANIKIKEHGIENIPLERGFIYCSKHMSNMEALVLYRRSPNLTALAKKELFLVPFLKLIFNKMGVLSINRGASEAQKQTPKIAKILMEKKIPMIIFSEGTRTVVGERRPLKSGVFYYQEEADLPVIVVAHNAGVHWPKKSWIKWPGELTFEYSEPMPRGLEKQDYMAEIEKRLLDRSEELML